MRGAIAVCTSAVVLGFALNASAADLPARMPVKVPPPVVAVYNWTGFYVGGNVGGAWTDADTHNSASPGPLSGFFSGVLFDGALPSAVSQRSSGVIGGVAIGYNFQSGSIVYGIEADISYLGIDDTSSVTTDIGFNPILTTTTETRLDWLGTLRARAGVLATPKSLVYLTAGLAFGNVESTTTIVIPAGGCAANAYCSVGSASEVQFGWTVGGGLEHALARSWSIKAEYLYFDLGDVTYTGRATAAFVAGLPTLDTEVTVKGHIARVGINYKF